ncbi:hypothetical protein ABZV29_00010 [Streptomyces sp. NPDC005236]|uniref:hypothetical protein n=1 Tax=Streptomyces sp. NPDC005236 TaxID=3157028 RepID=UPI00339F3CBD
MNASTPSEPTPEDGDPTSFAETAKNLVRKHWKTTLGVVGVVGLAAVLASLDEGQDDTEDSEDFEPFSEPVAEDQKRQSPCKHEVSGYQRKTKYGTQTVQSYSRGVSTSA